MTHSNEKDTFYQAYELLNQIPGIKQHKTNPDPLKYKSNCKDFGCMQIKFAILFYRFQSK